MFTITTPSGCGLYLKGKMWMILHEKAFCTGIFSDMFKARYFNVLYLAVSSELYTILMTLTSFQSQKPQRKMTICNVLYDAECLSPRLFI